MARHRWLAPEVIQTSGMDCGPAALKCLLEGFGKHVSYGRLREACQTDVDGTSIDTLEEIACDLGLDAGQTMFPADNVLLPAAKALPALIIVRVPGGASHFVVLWRKLGPWVQIMDPGKGRRWVSARMFVGQLWIHEQPLPAEAWRQWAGTDAWRDLQRARLALLGVGSADREALIEEALGDPGWRKPAALDATIRLVSRLVKSKSVSRGSAASQMVRALAAAPDDIPALFWSVQPHEPVEGEEHIKLRGAVLVAVQGLKPRDAGRPLSQDLAAALDAGPERPFRKLFTLLAECGYAGSAAALLAIVAASAGTALEALLLRALFDAPFDLPLAGQRLAALAAVLLLAGLLLALEFPLAALLVRTGRHFEIRLRRSFLEKIPRLGEKYFGSRPKSDMAERAHSLHRIRHLPEHAGRALRTAVEMVLTTAGLCWLAPREATSALALLAACLLPSFILLPGLLERDYRLRTHAGALGRFSLDALLGVFAVRAHGASGAMRQAFRELLEEWHEAALGLQKRIAFGEGALLALGYAAAAWLLWSHWSAQTVSASSLLLVYWALAMPLLGQSFAQIVWQFPGYRNTLLRLLEPLGAREQAPASVPAAVSEGAYDIEVDAVTVLAGGHAVLAEFSLRIPAGAHIAIVGASGSGKSSFAGLLLGRHKPAAGTLRIAGQEFAEGVPAPLRRHIAWVDPEVQLWNSTVLENITYGSSDGSAAGMADVIANSDLRDVLERLPEGLQTVLGEGGARVSGGQGQRVRIARALNQRDVKLVILDEAFRGLERSRRTRLLHAVRHHWRDATLLTITHDVGLAMEFARVIVIDAGKVIEDGNPAALASKPSRFREMLEAEDQAREALAARGWQRLRIDAGQVSRP
ncbi:MAG: ATP-binding cassette domain-containing protein [Bryobacteraceae bacterium]